MLQIMKALILGAQSNLVAMSWEDFCESFNPKRNQFNARAGLDGFLFGNSCVELDEVEAALTDDECKVWTVSASGLELVSGFRNHNASGYVITTVPSMVSQTYLVEID